MEKNMLELNNLDLAVKLLKKQNEIYQPTSFWAEASHQINKEIIEVGVEQFRRTPTALSFFVPGYGPPTSGLSENQVDSLLQNWETAYPKDKKSKQTLKHFLSGKQSALSDYRVFLASYQKNKLPALHNFSESTYGQPVEQFEWDGKRYSRSALNYLLGMSFLKQHLDHEIPKTILEIGGGFGTLGEIWSQAGIENWKYIDIDIPPTQFVADYYLKSILGSENVTSFEEVKDHETIDIKKLKPASVLCSWQIEHLVGEVDLFVNFISFQEMEPHVVKNYLTHVERLNTKWILLRNMREGKQIQKDGHVGVLTPIRSDDYVSMLPNYDFVESNVHPYGFETVDGFHSELQLFKRK